ncbi:hypothetical protein EK904_009359 [Melospiza melodia maxima]|nr:hypothetical protein EK904_009359 [Melospiza melodia maxima]
MLLVMGVFINEQTCCCTPLLLACFYRSMADFLVPTTQLFLHHKSGDFRQASKQNTLSPALCFLYQAAAVRGEGFLFFPSCEIITDQHRGKRELLNQTVGLDSFLLGLLSKTCPFVKIQKLNLSLRTLLLMELEKSNGDVMFDFLCSRDQEPSGGRGGAVVATGGGEGKFSNGSHSLFPDTLNTLTFEVEVSLSQQAA